MKKLLERITKRGTETPPGEVGAPQEPPGSAVEPTPPKLPPELPLFFMLSHLDDDGPVRLDGVKLGVCEVMGLEIDEPKLGAFAGALNALDFPAQLLIRQHPPRLGTDAGEARAGPAGGPSPADQSGRRVPRASALRP